MLRCTLSTIGIVVEPNQQRTNSPASNHEREQWFWTARRRGETIPTAYHLHRLYEETQMHVYTLKFRKKLHVSVIVYLTLRGRAS